MEFAEALAARQVYWAEPSGCEGGLRFPQYITPVPGERVALVMAIAALVLQPIIRRLDFGAVPVYSLARLEGVAYFDPPACRLCRFGVPLDRVGRVVAEDAIAAALA